MARCSVQIPQDFSEKLSHLGNKTDEIVGKVLEAGGEVVLEKVKSNLQSSLSGKSTGELANSLGLSKARVNREGNHDIKIGFAEPRSDSTSNAKLANIIEYGKVGRPPKPFMKPAKSATINAMISAMENKFNAEVENL
jgi:HK97 gp10 family phage protein